MNRYLCSTFSIQMLSSFPAFPEVDRIKATEVPKNVTSCISQEDTAQVVSNILGFKVPASKRSILLDEGDELYVAKVMGGRLPAGATTLPAGYSIRWFKVTA